MEDCNLEAHDRIILLKIGQSLNRKLPRNSMYTTLDIVGEGWVVAGMNQAAGMQKPVGELNELKSVLTLMGQ